MGYERRRLELTDEIETERHALLVQRESMKKQEDDLARRLILVEGLEREKQAIAKQQKELEKQRDELKLLDRRLRNSSGPFATGPPVLQQPQKPEAPPLLPGSDRGRKPNQTSVFRTASLATLSPGSPSLSSIRSRSSTPARRGGA